MVSSEGRIDLLACGLAGSDEGRDLVSMLETLSGRNIAASDDLTGNINSGGDWNLETDNVNIAPIYFDQDKLNDFTGVLATGDPQLVKDITSGTGGSNPDHFTEMGGILYFTATDNSGEELWRSDGTTTGTRIVKDINPGAGSSSPSNLVVYNNNLYFSADNGTNGTELWKSDGTEAGTNIVADINSGGASSTPDYLTPFGGHLYFSATDGSGNSGIELWKTDGTAANTVMVKDIYVGTGLSSDPQYLTPSGGELFFSATDGSTGTELWKTDGSGAGTVMVSDIASSASSSNPMHLTEVMGTLYFSADDGIIGRELWTSDGTNANTTNVENIDGGSGDGIPLANSHFTELGGNLYFVGMDGTNGHELWRSDGTAAGTYMVKDLNPGSGNAFVDNAGNPDQRFTVYDGELYFKADGGPGIGEELYRSDGTATGTSIVKDINPGGGF